MQELLFWAAFAGVHLQFVHHFKDEAGRPIGAAAAQRQGHGRCFDDLLPAPPQLSKTADMVFDSAVAPFADADAQGNQFLMSLGEHPIA